MKNIIKGVGAVLINSSGEVLLSYRKENTFYGNCWFVPCGTVEKGETAEKAIVREVKEELGVEVTVVDELSRRTNKNGYVEIVYVCKIINGTPQNFDDEDVSKIGYFSLDKLPEDIYPFIRESLAKIKK